MALDIVVNDSHGKIEKSISLYIDDYDFIMDKIEHSNIFPLLKKIFSDYYGDGEVYLNELECLKKEVLIFDEKFRSVYPKTISDFIAIFLSIIDYAVTNRKTIQLIGD